MLTTRQSRTLQGSLVLLSFSVGLISLESQQSRGDSGPTSKVGSSAVSSQSTGLERRSNRYEPLGQVFSYEGTSDVPSGWKMVTVAREPVSEARRVGEENYKGAHVFVYEVSVRARLPFDEGKPLSYKSGIRFVSRDRTAVAFYRFRQRTTDFDYTDRQLKYVGVADSATVRSAKGEIIATARLARLIQDEESGSLVGVEIKESHLDNSRVVFTCLSQYDLPAGFKRIEHVVSGRKITEYFPAWPVTGY